MKQYCETEMYLCDICDNVFRETHLLINHNILVHGLEEDDNLTYDCAICFGSFKDKLLFDLHQRSEGTFFQGMKGLQEVVNKFSTSELLSGTFLFKIIAKYVFI